MSGGMIPGAGGPNREYSRRTTFFVIATCIVAAMGSLIFGYDIGISVFPVGEPEEGDGNQLTNHNQYCEYNSSILTVFTSSLYLAALLASMVASTVTHRLGQKLSMFSGGVLFYAGANLNALYVLEK
ncbi:Sugar carrier protein C [Morus notabilis]|uniref:Sugar carrier protein C n=1 Tax=Morus notabilis TaxID=981085 RepID=W9R244_9ROSA|nr:Sugar carrier protein C [Morus notabilis]